MLIYFILISFWTITYFFTRKVGYQFRSVKWKNWYALLSGGALFLVMGLRSPEVGIDTMQYLYIYNYNTYDLAAGNIINSEGGFELFNSLFRNLGVGDQGYILITSLIISVSFSLFFYKYSKNMFLSFFLHLTIGLFTMSLSGLRQTLAACFILLAFKYIIEKKMLKFFIAIFVACAFHNSALVFLPIYFFRNIKIDKLKGILWLVLTISVLLFRESITPIVEYISPEKYILKYGALADTVVNPLVIIVAIAIPLACLFFWGELTNLNQKEKEIFDILFVLSCIGVLFNVLSLNSNLIGRLSFYFVPFNILLISNIISAIRDKKTRLIAVYICLILPFIQFVMTTPGGTLKIDQYRFFWQ